MLPDVLSFPPGTDLHDHPLVADKRLILQVPVQLQFFNISTPIPRDRWRGRAASWQRAVWCFSSSGNMSADWC